MLPVMIQVLENNIESVGYDKATNNLFVKYLTGSIYRYSNVPEYEFDHMLTATSKGAYIHMNIKTIYLKERING